MKLARLAILVFLALCCEHVDARAQSGQSADDHPSGDIIVTAPPRGAAEVASETEFGEEEIASYGADNIDELLGRPVPLIDASGEDPIILVNGKEIGFDRSILGYPAEALERLAVLKAEAAAHYGHPSGRRVVNLVLKKNYASRNAEAATTWATGGGQYGGSLTVGQVAIAGPVRWNAQGRVSLESALRKSARDIQADAGFIDIVGYVAPSSGEEIDPALSGMAGEIVTVVAIPAEAMTGAPTLADFAALANLAHPADRAGVPVIDQLAETGQSRHYLSLQAAAGKKGIGADLRAIWSSPAEVRGRQSSATQGNYRYRPPLNVDVSLFVEPDEIWTGAEEIGWLENLKISFGIENLLDAYRRATLGDGSVPPGFSRHEIDPLGRTVELSARKRF